MSRSHTIEEVVHAGLCMGCGYCAQVAESSGIQMSERKGVPIPVFCREAFDEATLRLADAVCPGAGYDIVCMAERLFGYEEVSLDTELGRYRSLYAMRVTDSQISVNASSGGIMTGVANHLLKTGRVQGVLVVGMSYGNPGPRPVTYIAQTRDELIHAQGSKYAPVANTLQLSSLREFPGSLAVLALPCHIAALRKLQERDHVLRKKIVCIIGNFCGGIKAYTHTDRIIARLGSKPEEVTSFRYRGGGQPGFMTMQDRSGQLRKRAYPAYEADTGMKKLKRCRLCIDATAELADLSCGDAWLPRFLNTPNAWSLVIARSPLAVEVLQEMRDVGSVYEERVTSDEIKKSQKSNLCSKKHRQAARRKAYKLVGHRLPAYDGGYPLKSSAIGFEFRIMFFHFCTETLEHLHLYVPFIQCIRWLRSKGIRLRFR